MSSVEELIVTLKEYVEENIFFKNKFLVNKNNNTNKNNNINKIKNQVELTTYQGYCTNVRTHIIPYFKKLNLNVVDISAVDINRYINYFLE